jgi:hypothetical protein
MKSYGSTFLVTLLVACLAIAAAASAAAAVDQQDERRLQSGFDLGDIFNGFFGDGFFLCNDGVDEPTQFYIYFLYLIGGIFFGGESGEFLGKLPGKCPA